MIRLTGASIFNVDADFIVNTVNCVGVMGAGLALEFKLRYPKMYKNYLEKTKRREIHIGVLDYYEDNSIRIINFPTKFDFKTSSELEWIESGLINFKETYKEKNVRSVAFPRLGTGKGNLNWDEVRRLMLKHLDALDIEVIICEDTFPAAGVEEKMLSVAKLLDLSVLDLKQDRYKFLEYNIRNADRFYDINSKGVGRITYEKIFLYCYNAVQDGLSRLHNEYTDNQKNKIFKNFIDRKWIDHVKLTKKQLDDVEAYLLNTRPKNFSFYDFITNKKIKKVSSFCLENISMRQLF